MKRVVVPIIAAVLALAAFGSYVTQARSSASLTNYKAETTPTPAQVQPAEPAEVTEPAGATEAADPAEPAGAAEVGHADATDDPNADHQFDGEE